MAEWEGGFCKCDNCGKRVYVESIDLWAYKMTTNVCLLVVVLAGAAEEVRGAGTVHRSRPGSEGGAR